MPPAAFQIGRVLLIAVVSALATVIVRKLDPSNKGNHDK